MCSVAGMGNLDVDYFLFSICFHLCIFLSETFVVHDYQYYADWTKITNNWTKDTTSVSDYTIYSLPSAVFNQDITVEFKFKNTLPSRWIVGLGTAPTTYKGIFSKEANMWIYWTPTSGSVQYVQINPSISANTIFKLTTENLNKINWYVDNTIQAYRDTNTNLPLTLFIREMNSDRMELEYIKVY